MRIALVGANGQLGSDLRKRLQGEVVALRRPEFDVRREDLVESALASIRPQVVVNCAALTNVDACEDQAQAAFAVNARGAMHVARQAENAGAAVLYVSTDYVFGVHGARGQAYTEDDPPGPVNVYGASKLAGEHLTRAYSSRCFIVRTCGLYGRAGARGKGGNFVETMLRLAAEDKPIRVVDDQRLSPTSTRELAEKIAALIESGAYGLYHVAASDDCTWFQFANAIFQREKLAVNLQPISSGEFSTRARRPAMSAIRTLRLPRAGVTPCRTWREMLHEYLDDRR